MFLQKRFVVPASDDQSKIPFGRVNHNKYMVTDRTAYIGTSNWAGDYFIDTAGIGLILQDNDAAAAAVKLDSSDGTTETENRTEKVPVASTLRTDLVSVFERDWSSLYALDLH